MNRSTPLFRWTARLALLLLTHQALPVMAQGDGDGRTLSPGDEVALTVPGRPELDSDLLLDAAGRVTIEQVGEVSLAGLTVDEASEVLRQRLRLFYPSIDNLTLELRSASQMLVYVIGAVRAPGHYEFASPPSVWELVRSAGGPADDADLAVARIIRQERGTTTVFSLDLSGMMAGNDVPSFRLRNGDTLAIPGRSGDGTATVPGNDGVQVFGGVAEPVTVPIKEPTLLMDVLMRAGAPTDTANLEKVWWVHRAGGGYVSSDVNVRSFIEAGDPAGNPLVHPGDTIEVEITRPSWVTTYLPLILGTIATAATVVLAWDRVTQD
jgi:protein involved in polysaccharide export with SLBB domain